MDCNSYASTSRKVRRYLEDSQILWKRQVLPSYLVNYFFSEQMGPL